MIIASSENSRYQPVTGHKRAGTAPVSERPVDSRPGDEFTPAEQKELEGWKERLRPEMGELQTPPAGPSKEEQLKAQGYIVDLVDKLAGKDLTERGIELRMELFSGDVPQAALDDDMSREAVWKEEHPDQAWPVRGWLGVPDGSDKPIYRLTVNLGLLRTLKTEDELAFVLAQQTERLLDHDRRDPENEEQLSPANKNFLDSRDWQSAADRAAIARMNRAGFNPRGAYHALNTLYQTNPISYPADDLNRGLVAAAHGHEHEGMRVGLVQAEVETYVRRSEPNTAREMKPLPAEVSIQSPAGYQKAVNDPAAYQHDYRSLALSLATEETPAWMFHRDVPPLEFGRIKLAGGTPEDKEKALLNAVEGLSQSNQHSSQQKVDGFLRLLVALRLETLPEEPFSEQSMSTINGFLRSQSTDWQADGFVSSLVDGEDSLQRAFISSVVFNENFQNMASGALPGLAATLPKAWVTDIESRKEKPEEIKEFISKNHEDGSNSWPLASLIDQASLDYVTGLDGAALAKEKARYGASRAMALSNELLGMGEPSPSFQLRLREAAQGLVEASAAEREGQARLRLRPPFQDPKELNGYLLELGQSETWKGFSSDFQADLPKLLKDLALVTTTQPDLLYADERQGALNENLERRVAELVANSSPEEQKPLLNFLARHTPHELRVRGMSPRRAWLGEAAVQALGRPPIESLVEDLSKPDLSQHSGLIAKSLADTYGLRSQDLPDTSTSSLETLNERVKAGEFEPKRENYTSDSAFDQARQAYRQKQDELYGVFSLVAPLESRLVLGKMALLGHNPELSKSVTERLDLNSFQRILEGAEKAQVRAETLTELAGDRDTEYVGSDAGAFLLDGFLAVQSKVDDLSTWYDLATRSMDFSQGGLEARVTTRRQLAGNLYQRLEKLEGNELREWVGKDKVLELLNAQQASDLLVKVVGERARPGADLEQLSQTVQKLDSDLKLNDEHPVVYLEMRDKLAEIAKLQPSNVDLAFPPVERGVTDTTAAYKNQARALSGVVAIARQRSPQEQIDTIEYLMGRQEIMPAYLETAADSQSFAPLSESLQTTRQELLEADNQTRVMVANGFLAGPSGLLRSEGGRQTLIDHFLKNLHPDNRELGTKIANAVLYSQGEADTLAAAFILGQKPEESEEPGKSKKLDEATILNRLFDAYGVPGIKMKQYLAFTAEFKDFREAFESAQDASMPLNYYQVLKLVQKRFGDEWPKDLSIDKVLGSGSVNVAIRYRNESTGQREVVSLGREDIQESTSYDFVRFNKFIEELTRTPEDRERFGFVLGLLKLTEDSVNLEFEKEQAMAVQKHAYQTYSHQVGDWNIRSIDAYRVQNLGLFMEEAKGKTARKIYIQDKELYSSAMEAMAKVEFGVLKGQTAENNWIPKPLFANPDFHDGQVLIDKDEKTVTILDFGQAVPIDNKEREAGLDMLSVVAKADSAKAAAKRLNKRYFNKEKVLTPEDLKPVLERVDRMDCFIHLLSTLSLKGADVPLSAIHWVLGVNRQMALGEKINKPIDSQIRNMIINHKIGLPLATYNAAHGTAETAARWGRVAADTAVTVAKTIVHTVGGWFGWESSESLFKSESTPTNEPKRVEAKYKAWRPNFGGTHPTRATGHGPTAPAPS